MSEPTYLVVINSEEQYSVWEEQFPLPAGWQAEGFSGPRQACLDYIDTVWTDMRPRSLRLAMEGTDLAVQAPESAAEGG